MVYSFFTTLSLIALSIAAPPPSYVSHEQRDHMPPGWSRGHRIPSREVLPMRIGLTQSNLDKGHDFLMDVSHPDSVNFGKHWTPDEVAKAFAPSQKSVDSVFEWLTTSGIAKDRITQSSNRGWITFNATVGEAEDLLKTEYFHHQHVTGKPHIGCDQYQVPEHVAPHVDIIIPTVHFDTKIPMAAIDKRAETSSTAAAGVPVQTKAAVNVLKSPTNGFLPKKGSKISSLRNLVDELKNCDKAIVPNCLRALYRFPPGITANPQNSYGIVEYTPQAYLKEDLAMFFANFSRNQVQKEPSLNAIDGGVVQRDLQGFGYNGESDLDLEYAMTLVNPQKVTLYQVGDTISGATFNNFLDAIDADYCTKDGGDDPTQDVIYPEGVKQCGAFKATKVISTSYGYNEADLTAKYEQRQCQEYMKLGLQGVSILYSSGDSGVAGNGAQCIGPDGQYNNGGSGKFNPSFPGTCPYITSVGATQVNPGSSVLDPESACEQVIYSGGGFSNVFAQPSYQKKAVASYYANYNPSYGADRYNNSRQTRGYPDISANGANYVVAVNGAYQLVYGTSASTPVVGAIFTLINEARLKVGKSVIGFVNPTLYSHPHTLTDITSGGNQGCGTPGFQAVPGWDPVTGLGTPNFPRLLVKYLSLP